MKNFLSIFSLNTLKNNVINITNRFPVSIVLVLIVSVLFFVNLHSNFSADVIEHISRIILSLIITFFFSVWVYITTENLNYSKLKRNLFELIPIWFWLLLYIVIWKGFDSFENILYLVTSWAWIIFYLFYAPFLKNILKYKINQEIFYDYFYKIWIVFLISVILWWVLFALWSIWIWTVFQLFEIRSYVSDKIYQDWAILALSFITPLFALAQLPNKESFNKNDFYENIFFSFLIKYIVIPFVYIYFIILYAYSIKLLLNLGDWPKWEVSWMVIGFSILWYITYIFSYTFETKNKFISFFRKGLPYVVIPQIFILFYAIYLRINQYDLTVNRYFVVVFWIWLLFISIYYLFSKKKYLIVIPFILTIFTIVISIWPWSVHSLPQSRQLVRLNSNLVEAWILTNDWIVWLEKYEDIDKDLSRDIYSWIEYLCDFNNCNSIKDLFPKIYENLLEKNKKEFEERQIKDKELYKNNPDMLEKVNQEEFREPSKWEIVSEITTTIKVRTYYWTLDERELRSISFNLNNEEDIFPIDITWYSQIYILNDFNKDTWNHATIDLESREIQINKNDLSTDTINIDEIIENLLKIDTTDWVSNLSKEELTFTINSNNKEYKVIFSNISLPNPNYTWEIDSRNYFYASWYMLVK